jgi:hypothetical protein
MTVIAILLKSGPWLLAAAGVLFGMFRHQQARAVTAQIGQKAAEAQATAAAARAGRTVRKRGSPGKCRRGAGQRGRRKGEKRCRNERWCSACWRC